MKIAVVILNVLLLLSTGLILAGEGFPSPGDKHFALFLLMVAAPAFTIISLLPSKSESWPALYFKRKAAEERKRIGEIEG